MNVLISGNLSCLTTTLVNSFVKEKYKVIVVSSHADELNIHLPDTRVYSVSPATDYFQEIVSAHKFDAVVYLATREEQLMGGKHQTTGEILDGLLNVLDLCRKERIERIFYISSTEIYGSQEVSLEGEEPLPVSPNGFNLRTGEEYCSYYSEQHGLTPTILRVPFLYGPGEKGTFLHDLMQKCLGQKKVVLPGHSETMCSFLHAADVAEFILRALDVPADGCQILDLPSADPLTFAQLVELFKAEFPEAKFEYNPSGRIWTRPAAGQNAKRFFDWIAERKLANEFTTLIDDIRHETKPRRYLLEVIRSHFPRYQTFLKWVEVMGGAGLMHYMTVLSGQVVEFRYVDFRLAFIFVIGGIYGTQTALFAAALASLSLLVSMRTLDLNWAELLYNVSNWLPFALYLSTGVITGYFHDKKENDTRFLEDQIEQVKDKYTFLYELYGEVTNLKNQFHQQLVGSRDSYGRIFNIARELDTLEEEEVIFKALHILEDVLDNHSIAIYSIHQASCYARLEIYSSSLQGQVTKSVNLRDYPELVDSIEKGEIFQNTLTKPGLPAYFVPMKKDGMVVAGVAVWNANFDQLSLYYSNLLNVICGLIESSINRVSVFINTNLERYYLPNTRILYSEYFEKVLKVKNKIKKNRLGSHILVKVGAENNGHIHYRPEDLYTQITSVTRAEDYVGIMGDGHCYILFSQADQSNANTILNRLAQRGIPCHLVPDNYPLVYEAPAQILIPEAVENLPIKRTGPLYLNNGHLNNGYASNGHGTNGQGNNSHTSAPQGPQDDHPLIIPHTGGAKEETPRRLGWLWDELRNLK